LSIGLIPHYRIDDFSIQNGLQDKPKLVDIVVSAKYQDISIGLYDATYFAQPADVELEEFILSEAVPVLTYSDMGAKRPSQSSSCAMAIARRDTKWRVSYAVINASGGPPSHEFKAVSGENLVPWGGVHKWKY
jgi:hypothetical protein